MDSRTGFLFPDPSFAEGVGRLADFSGALNRYNISSSPRAADRRATRADWEMVDEDLRNAGGKVVEGQKRKKSKR